MMALSIAMLVICLAPALILLCFGFWAAAGAGKPYPGTIPHRYGPKYPKFRNY